MKQGRDSREQAHMCLDVLTSDLTMQIFRDAIRHIDTVADGPAPQKVAREIEIRKRAQNAVNLLYPLRVSHVVLRQRVRISPVQPSHGLARNAYDMGVFGGDSSCPF